MISIMAGLEIVVLELYQISPALTARRHSALRIGVAKGDLA
jgi:hypothetical protein